MKRGFSLILVCLLFVSVFFASMPSVEASVIYENTTTGNVGIGTTSPGQRLEVAGGNIKTGVGYGIGNGANSQVIYDGTDNTAFMRFDVGGAERMRIINTGNVGIGNTNPAYKLDVAGKIKSSQQIVTPAEFGYEWWTGGYTNSSYWQLTHRKISDTSWTNAITVDTLNNVGIGKANPAYKLDVAGAVGATDFLYTSDMKLKENIKPLEGSLGKILELQGVSFNWKDDGEENIGLIAQDVEKVYPELVEAGSDGIKSVKYGNLVAPLIESVKEQNKRIDNQQKEIDELKREIERLKDEKRWL